MEWRGHQAWSGLCDVERASQAGAPEQRLTVEWAIGPLITGKNVFPWL